MTKQAGISDDAVENLAFVRDRDSLTVPLGGPFGGYARSQDNTKPPEVLDNYVLAAGDRHFLLAQLDDVLRAFKVLVELVDEHDPAITDAFIFGENIREQRLAHNGRKD